MKNILMLNIQMYNPASKPSVIEKEEIVNFLFNHLDEFGDPSDDILKAIDYGLKETPSFGGFVLVGRINNEIVSAVVINQTGMKGYIPENILVYIACHKNHRGKGIGKQIMLEAIKLAHGDIALHVEPDNPAAHLYKKLGFTSKYLEMRLVK